MEGWHKHLSQFQVFAILGVKHWTGAAAVVRRSGIPPRRRMAQSPALRLQRGMSSRVTSHSRLESALLRVEVNGVQLKTLQEVQLQHLDCVVLGRSVMLYVLA